MPTARERDQALDRLRILTPTQAIRDPALNHALLPFRGFPPTALMCANATCTAPFAWVGLDATTARVRFGPTAPGETWLPNEAVAEVIANPGDPLLRWRFRCQRCQRPCPLSNHRLVTLVLRALASGRTEVTPAEEE